MIQGLLFCFGLWLAYLLGWSNAHHTVARECERLGGFYVNGKTFNCIEVEARK